MRASHFPSFLAFLALVSAGPLGADAPSGVPNYWLAGEVGYGSAHLSTSLGSRSRAALALGVEGGVALNPYLDVGLRLNGWTIEASNLNDPSKGESLSQVLALLRVRPMPGARFFLRGGVGYASYTNNHPLASGGHGWGFSLGLGYEQRLSRGIQLMPTVNFSLGRLGAIDNALASIHDRRFDVVDFSLGIRFP